MREKQILRAFFVLATAVYVLNVFLLCQTNRSPSHSLLAQSTYFGPKGTLPGNPQLIKVEVLVRDSPQLAGVQVEKVFFDGKSIPLKPRGVAGKRGEGSFQLPPGKYSLQWTVLRDKLIWPRTQTFHEEVLLSPKDLWVQILIEGEQASIR